MKISKYFLFLSAAAVFFSFSSLSCSMSIPESVSVKTSADFNNISFGRTSVDMSETMDAAVVFGDLSSTVGGLKGYNYKPERDVLTYLMKYDLFTIPFDVGKAFNDIDLDTILSESGKADFSMDFKLPSVDIKMESEFNPGAIIRGSIELPLPAMDIPLTEVAGFFKQMTVKSGKISVTVELPAAWTDVSVVPVAEISGAGLSGTLVHTGGSEYSYNLAGKTIDFSAENKVQVSVKLIISSGSERICGEGEEIKTGYAVKIDSLSSAVLDFTFPGFSGMNRSFVMDEDSPFAVPMPSGFTQIEAIRFCQDPSAAVPVKKDGSAAQGRGIKCSVKNTLPADISMILKSTTFSLDSSFDIPANTNDYTEKKFVQYEDIDATSGTGLRDDYVNLEFSLPDTLVLGEVVLGNSYSISIKFEGMVFDWDGIKLNLEGFETGFSDEVEFGAFSLGDFLKDLNLGVDVSSVKIKSVPAFFYIQKPDIPGMDFSMRNSTVKFGAKTVLDSSSEITFVSKSAPWPEGYTIEADDETLLPYLTVSDTNAADRYYSFGADLADVLNANEEGDMKIEYSLNFSQTGCEGWIYSSDVMSASVSALGVQMAMLLKMDLIFTSSIYMDIMSLVNTDWNDGDKDKDLLGRENDNDFEDKLKYADIIDFVNIGFVLEKSFLVNRDDEPNTFVCQFSSKGRPMNFPEAPVEEYINKEIPILQGDNVRQEITLTDDDARNVMTYYPFHPDIKLRLEASPENPAELALSPGIIEKDQAVVITLSTQIKFNGENQVEVWSK